jgi:outer membrane receptor protein involved in Fe transport
MLRGAGSALYGAGAIGGVLQLDTFGPLSAPPGAGSVSVAAGSNQGVRNYANVEIPLSPWLGASFSAAQAQLSYLDLPPAYASPIDVPAQSQTSMASFRLRYARSAHTSLEYGYRGAWDYQQEGRPNYDFWRRLDQHALTFTQSNGHTALAATGYVRSAVVTNRADVYPKAPGTLRYTQSVPTNESGVSVQWVTTLPQSEFSVRADERSVTGDSEQYGPANALQSAGSGAQELSGLALQEILSAPRTELVAGVRADSVDLRRGTIVSGGHAAAIPARVDRAVSPRVALRYDLTPQLAFRISDGAGFRAPFLNELVRGYQIGSVAYLPNPALVPERSSSLSAGFDWNRGRMRISLDGIHTFVNDAISFRTVDPVTQIRSNIAQTQTDGETLIVTREISAATRVQIFGTAQYARVTGGDPATIGKRLSYVPNVEAGATLDTAVGAIGAGLTLIYAGQMFADDLNTSPLGTSLLAGVHLSLPLRAGASITIDVENATNARYLSSVDRYGPPATVWIGMTIPTTAHSPK